METDDREKLAEQRRVIVRRHARLSSNGQPRFCNAGRAELAEADRLNKPVPRYQVIYDSVEVAEKCEKELRGTDGLEQEAYVCHRSRSGHAHLRKVRTHRSS